MLVEVDDVDLGEEVRVVVFEMRDEHGGDFVEAEQHDVPVDVVAALFMHFARVALGIALAAKDPPAGPAQQAVELVVLPDHHRRQNGHDGEGPNDDGERVLLDVALVLPQTADHQGEFADLRQVDRGHCGQAVAPSEHVHDQEDTNPSHNQDGERDQESLSDDRERGRGDLHPQAHEEQRDEEVPDVLDLAVELGAVGERRQRDAGDEGRELHGQADEGQGREGAHEEAPRQRDHQHQLHGPRRVREDGWHHKLRVPQGDDDQGNDHAEREEDAQHLWALQVGLDGQHHDRPNVLEDQDAHREAAGGGVHLRVLGEQLDDDHGRGDRAGHADVHRREVALPEGEAGDGLEPHEDARHDDGAEWELEQARADDDPAHLEELADVELEPDHEEQEDQAQGAELLDVREAVHDVHAVRADEHAANEVPEDQRQVDEGDEERRQAGGGEAERHLDEHQRCVAAQAAVRRVPGGVGRVGRVGEVGGPGDQDEHDPAQCDEVDEGLLPQPHGQGAAQEHVDVGRGVEGVAMGRRSGHPRCRMWSACVGRLARARARDHLVQLLGVGGEGRERGVRILGRPRLFFGVLGIHAALLPHRFDDAL
mmetsp:Transcript_27608/g.83244  ORF Transcript_27608/g.83244 Transcript_27608/m.83244 type:complete len:596 (+) Transcript_27608:236-2023(+)